ncbi:hypothetical protein H920_19287 [Fukomys damarensis]|uniref:Uncharacterized protein n=1 Tax=Fukomys damarensis TaxID=885580 RepID=A0A091D944_FUKDA|nr:hypothetical protein H920_19287 [Fukomys damarensis]
MPLPDNAGRTNEPPGKQMAAPADFQQKKPTPSEQAQSVNSLEKSFLKRGAVSPRRFGYLQSTDDYKFSLSALQRSRKVGRSKAAGSRKAVRRAVGSSKASGSRRAVRRATREPKSYPELGREPSVSYSISFFVLLLDPLLITSAGT